MNIKFKEITMKKKKTSQLELFSSPKKKEKKRITPDEREYLRKRRLSKLIVFLEGLEKDPKLFSKH